MRELENIKDLRKIVYKKNNNKFIWIVSLLGKEREVDGRITRDKDRKFTGNTLEEALANIQ
jgi:hypothetical protein